MPLLQDFGTVMQSGESYDDSPPSYIISHILGTLDDGQMGLV
jgi:hypothetical protein